MLQNPVTKDLVTDTVQESLLGAQQLGQDQLNTFVEERLTENHTSGKKFCDPIKKNKPATFANLYITSTNTKAADKETILKDRS